MVHDVLAPATGALLREVAALGPFQVAVDLGCGPGPTSRLIDEVLHPTRLVGLDISEPFLQLARETVPRGKFFRHDVRGLPWPGSPADVAFSRYLLTHLPDPEDRVREWMSQLRPGGLLVLEENEWIACREPVFAHYLEVVGDLLAGRGQDLHVGRRLTAVEPRLQLLSRIYEVPAPTAPVAAMFRLNLSAWAAQVDGHRLDAANVDRELAALETSTDPHGITWALRQLVFQTSRGGWGRPKAFPSP